MRMSSPLKSVIAIGLGVLLVLVQSLGHADAETPERIEWKKAPIRLVLAVGQEQRIEFPAAVKVGVPAPIQPLLRAQSVNGTVYLLARAPFSSKRLMVRELDSGRIYLFDVTAAEAGGANPPIQITVADDSQSDRDSATTRHKAGQKPPGYIELTRFAVQQLYAPTRLVKDWPGVVRMPVARDPIALLRGGTVEANPLVAWRAGGLYVTAVKLTNRTDHPQFLDPRDLRGTWLTATFQHHRLLAQGNEADTTAVYLISARPFDASR